MIRTYVYGIIPTGSEVIFEVGGLDGDDDEIRALPHGDLAAVIGPSPLASYQGLRREEAIQYLVAHQRVIESVMRDFPVLPVKFGTVLPDESWALRALAQGESVFRNALDKLRDRVQMEIVALWDLGKVFEEIGEEEPIVQLKARIAEYPPCETETDRISLGRMVQASLEQRRTALQGRLRESLQSVAPDMVVNPCMDDRMVANFALLVDKASRGALDRQLDGLDQEFEGRLLFRCVGPLPPYSFATIEVQMFSFEELDAARRQLGLPEIATFQEIRSAYRKIASQIHPDHSHNDPEAESRTAELTKAYKLLLAYAGNHTPEQKDTPEKVYSCARNTVEDTLHIAIQRQGVAA
ncbi:MAG: hypothetical protein A2Y73_07330 [Chloroflexi bacterium RBG_13_56_8]|nr:MAG: hypothetical protein A2Y73_07330 [Chloroflexi bacterium RBG_13_56_8]